MFKKNYMKKQYSMFVGRWQPLHEGHKYIFNERLKLGKNVCIAIRDVEPNENQPWTAEEIKQNYEQLIEELKSCTTGDRQKKILQLYQKILIN